MSKRWVLEEQRIEGNNRDGYVSLVKKALLLMKVFGR
jgi:hypothetical protein